MFKFSKGANEIFTFDVSKDFSLKSLYEKIDERDFKKIDQLFKDAIDYGITFKSNFKIIEDDKIKYFDIYVDKHIKDGKVDQLYGLIQDVSEQERAKEEIKYYLKFIDKNVITSTTNTKGVITSVSEAFCDISGYSKEELIGYKHSIVRHPDMSNEIYVNLWNSIKSGKTWSGDIKNRKKNGDFYWVKATISPKYNHKNEIIAYSAIRQDITDKKLVEYLSITDALTTLYNRRYFNEVSQNQILKAKESKKIFAFALLDIDNFKKYNDTYGHQDGDTVLIKVASSLKSSFEKSDDLVFRLGGEEFGVIFSATTIEDATHRVNVARENILSLHIEHEKNPPHNVVSGSFGLILAYTQGYESDHDIDFIYKEVDEMLYEAKEQGRNRVCLKQIS